MRNYTLKRSNLHSVTASPIYYAHDYADGIPPTCSICNIIYPWEVGDVVDNEGLSTLIIR